MKSTLCFILTSLLLTLPAALHGADAVDPRELVSRLNIIDERPAATPEAGTGTEPAVPRFADLLGDPAFHPLAQWLRQRQVDLDDLPSAVDQFLAQARQAARV